MIQSVSVFNDLGQYLNLELSRPEDTGILVTNISGLGPVRANVSTTSFAALDGGVINSARLDCRNIVLEVSLLGSPSVEETRELLYRAFPVKKEVTFVVTTDLKQLYTIGTIESNEQVIFSNKCSAQISIICPDPYFYNFSPNETTVFSGIVNGFEFPFSNESTDEKLIELGEIVSSPEIDIFYEGTSEIGMIMYIDALGPVENFTIYNLTTRKQMTINTTRLSKITGKGFGNKDRIVINTESKNKSIMLLRDGVYTNILAALEVGSDWVSLERGDNILAYNCESGIGYIQMYIEHGVRYEGI